MKDKIKETLIPATVSEEFIKRKAKHLKKATGITHVEALNTVVKDYGFDDWNHFKKAL